MKGLYWCQYVLGIGHLMRALRISRCLTEYFDLDFLQGGRDINLTCDSPRFQTIKLPAISNNDFEPITGKLASKKLVPSIFKERQKILESSLDGPYDFCFIGSFPLGKLGFTDEILSIIHRVKKNNPECVFISSVNDFTTENSIEAAFYLNTYIDHLFIHADPHFMRLEDYSLVAREARGKSFYTGYVTAPLESPPPKREHQILVTAGGGGVCEELTRAAADAALLMPETPFLFTLGPNCPLQLQTDLQELQENAANIHLKEIIHDFGPILQKSALVISTAGSTLADLCLTHTPGLIYPFISEKSNEQLFRAKAFADKGVVSILSPPDLKPEKLVKLIKAKVGAPYPKIPFNGNGAENTVLKLLEILEMKKRIR